MFFLENYILWIINLISKLKIYPNNSILKKRLESLDLDSKKLNYFSFPVLNYYKFLFEISIFNKINLFFIFFNYLVFTYKFSRYYNKLPIKSKNSKNKKLLKNRDSLVFFKLVDNYKNFFSINDLLLVKSVIFLEYINLLWKLNWTSEWFDLKRRRLFYSKKINKNLKIKHDTSSILLELSNIRSRLLKKKVKVTSKNSYVLLGFNSGTCLNYLK